MLKFAYRLILGLILIPLLAGLNTAASAEEADLLAVDDIPVYSLEDCIDIAMQDNIGLQRARIGVDISILDHVRNAAVFDPGFELDFSTRHTEAPDTTQASSDSSSYDFAARYVRPTWNGSQWVFSVDQNRSDGSYNIGEDMSDFTSYTSQIGLTFSMPILEGYGERVNRVGVQRADLGILRSEATVRDAERSVRYSVIQAYIYSVLSAKQIDVAGLSLETAENLVTEVQARIDVGQLAPYELLAAQAGLAERMENLLNGESSYVTARDALKELIGLPIHENIEVDTDILRPIFMDVDAESLYILAQRNRPDLEGLDLRIQQAELDLFLAGDRRQSSLSWTTVLGLAGQDEGYSQSISDMNNFTWYTGLQYRVPLGGNRGAEVDVTTAQLNLDQLHLEREELLRRLQLDIRLAVEEFNNAMLRIDVTAQGLVVQEVKMESERLRHDLGLITARDLLEFDLDLANARLGHDNALADILLALAKLEFLVNADFMEDAIMLQGVLNESTEMETAD